MPNRARSRSVEIWSYGGDAVDRVLKDFQRTFPEIRWQNRRLSSLPGYYLEQLIKEAQKPWTPLALAPVHYRELSALIRRGWVRALDGCVPPARRAAWPEAARMLGTRDGVLYAAPEDFAPYVLMVREDQLQKRGQGIPSTWLELEAQLRAARKPVLGVQDAGPVHRFGFIAGLLGSNGLDLSQGLDLVLQQHAALEECYEWLQRMVKARRFAYPTHLHSHDEAALKAFRARSLTYCLGWPGALNRWTKEELRGVRLAPFPRGPSGQAPCAAFVGSAWCIPHNTASLDLAQELLRALTEPGFVKETELAGGAVFPPLKALWRNPDILKTKPIYADAPTVTRVAGAYAPDYFDPELQQLEAAFEESVRTGRDGSAFLEHLLRRSRRADRARVQSEVLRAAVAYVDAHLERVRSVREIAAAVKRHPDHLNRLFRSELKLGVKAYLDRRRMERARDMLLDVTLSIKEIAARLGFAGPSSFGRACRAHWGCTPQALRKREVMRFR